MSEFDSQDFNNLLNTSVNTGIIGPTQGIIPQLEANRTLTGVGNQEVKALSLTPDTSDNIILGNASQTKMTNGTITDTNTTLPDSAVDLITGQAMSEVYGDLTKFAADPAFTTKMNLAFGENWDAVGAKALAEEWYKGDFSAIPPVKVVSSAEIGGANGAFAAATDTIYLSKEFLAQNGANPVAIADVLLHEIGHSVDARLNVTDTPGDEGAIFAAVVQGKELSQQDILSLKTEVDGSYVTINNKETYLELSRYVHTSDQQFPSQATLSTTFGLEQGKWNTDVSLYISDPNPVAGEIIKFQLTIDFKNFFNGGIPGGTTPYTVFGYVPTATGSYGRKTTEAFPPLESWLGVRNGNFVNPKDWDLQIIYNPNAPKINTQVNVGASGGPFSFGGSINFETDRPDTKNFLSLDDKGSFPNNWDVIGIKDILQSGSDTGKFIGSGAIQLTGYVQAENVRNDWLQVFFQTASIYSYNSNSLLVGYPFPDTYYDYREILAHVYAPLPEESTSLIVPDN
jgi:hypothetical protein